MAAHNEIRIPFELDDRRYEAVGFLRERKLSVDGDEMLRRTAGENDGAIGAEDEAFIRERRAKLPKELRRYILVTNRRNPGYPRFVSCFFFLVFWWFPYCFSLDSQWSRFFLVVRRCS